MKFGYKKCPEWLKLTYRRAVGYYCQECGKNETEVGTLRPHRLKRGAEGGTYVPNNVKMLCKTCHAQFHFKEGKAKS